MKPGQQLRSIVRKFLPQRRLTDHRTLDLPRPMVRAPATQHGSLRGLAIFQEEFDPARTSLFDTDLDEIVTTHALRTQALTGYCNIAGAATTFTIHSDNLREDIVAAQSRSFNRQRQIVCGLSSVLLDRPDATLAEIATQINQRRLTIYTAEANSALFEAMRAAIDPALLSYSEYFGPQYRSGELVVNVPHQDLQHTAFADAAFDLILSSEVFEHIPDALAAEREVVRILRPGGWYVFTAPFLPFHEHDIVLADLDEHGTVRHYGEPQYHGDPVRPEEGILVYRLFSYADLLTRFTALGCSFRVYRFWSKSLGILGNNALVKVAQKL